jgi:hypothetical protein
MWKAVIRSRFSDGKINARKMALEQLCQMLTVFVDQLGMTHVTSAESSMLPILELLLAVASNSLVSTETVVTSVRFEVLKVLFLWIQVLLGMMLCCWMCGS